MSTITFKEQSRLIVDGTATKADIAEVRADIAVVKAELAMVKWLVGGVGFGVFALILKTFFTLEYPNDLS